MEPNDCVRLGQLGWQCTFWKILASVRSRSMDKKSGGASWGAQTPGEGYGSISHGSCADYSCALAVCGESLASKL